jgi:hypothetical protein
MQITFDKNKLTDFTPSRSGRFCWLPFRSVLAFTISIYVSDRGHPAPLGSSPTPQGKLT